MWRTADRPQSASQPAASGFISLQAARSDRHKTRLSWCVAVLLATSVIRWRHLPQCVWGSERRAVKRIGTGVYRSGIRISDHEAGWNGARSKPPRPGLAASVSPSVYGAACIVLRGTERSKPNGTETTTVFR
uniref:Uncharacterized protein n=1 Tax=Anopheles minimus TaxID=112268 RepID=A0A182WPS2_9DIPT